MKNAPSFFGLFVLTLLVISQGAFAGSGGLDSNYQPYVNSTVNAMALQSNGELLIGGNFTAVGNPSVSGGGVNRNHIARLYADGSLDGVFLNGLSGASGNVNAVVAQSDGHIVIGGNFSSVNGSARYGVARLNSNGTLDGSFVTAYSSYSVNAVAVQSDNKVIVGGNGTLYRLNADGTNDSGFYNMISQPTVYAIAIQPDGKILVGGYFSTFVGTTRNNLVRLNSDGSIDGSFLNIMTGASGNVRCIVVQPDGKILIGGDFTSVNNTSRYHIARLTSSGAVDTGFSSSAIYSGGSIYTMSLQSDGSILVGGNIVANYYNNGASYYSYNVARLFADGTMDNLFICSNNLFSTTYATAIQNDGSILVGGNFYSSLTNHYLCRVYGNLYPPEFNLQPTNRQVGVGANVTFAARVSNPTPVSFQWRKNGSDISGATAATYSLSNVQPGDAGTYAVFAMDSLGGVTSSNAVLTVGIPPSITQQPVSLTVTQGQTAAFTVVAGGSPVNYFWKRNGFFLPDATNSSLTFTNATLANAAIYSCVVSNFLGSVTSSNAALTVVAPPAIVTQPVDQTVAVSSNFTVSVTATGTAPLVYQWFKDTTALTNFTSNSVIVADALISDSGGYFVIVSNSIGSVTSSIANITVTNFPPSIIVLPVGGNYLVGSNFSMSVIAGGTAPYAYQWANNGAPIPGAVSQFFSVTNAQTNDSGAYTVIITNIAGGITSAPAMVNVGYAPFITRQPLSITNNIGDTNGFSVAVFGSEPLLYQWFKDGAQIPNATNASLLLPNLQPAQIGCYSVSVTNVFGGTVSSNAALNLSGYAFGAWQGLLAWYPFDGDASDASGNGNDAAVYGAVLATNRLGDTNAAYYFGGSGQYIFVTNSPSLNAGGAQITLCAWINFDVGGSDNPSFISKNGDAGYEMNTLGTGSQRQLSWWIGTNEPGLTSVQLLNSGQWYFVTATFDGGSMALYINGVLDSVAAATGTFGNAIDLVIGQNSQTGADRFAGEIDDVRIYNRALAPDDVTAVYDYDTGQPLITRAPQSQTNAFGSDATFTVEVASSTPVIYQWQFNSNNIPDATNSLLVLTNLQFTNAGWYGVTVSNAWSGASASSTLAVTQTAARLLASSESGGLKLWISGLTGHGQVVLFTSTNLVDWQPIETNSPQTGAVEFTEHPGDSQRFYRAMEQ